MTKKLAIQKDDEFFSLHLEVRPVRKDDEKYS